MFSINRAEIDAAAKALAEKRRECQLSGLRESVREREAEITGQAENFLLRFEKEIKQSLVDLCSISTNLAFLSIIFTLNGRDSRAVSVAIDILSNRLKEAGFYTHVYKYNEIDMRVTVFSSFEGKITEENSMSLNTANHRNPIHGCLHLAIQWSDEQQHYNVHQRGIVWNPPAFLR